MLGSALHHARHIGRIADICTSPDVWGTSCCPPTVCTDRRQLQPVQALLQSKIARNADFAVMLGEAHMDALGEDTYTKLMQDYVALGGPQPEPRLSDSLVRQPCFPVCAFIGRLAHWAGLWHSLKLLQQPARRQGDAQIKDAFACSLLRSALHHSERAMLCHAFKLLCLHARPRILLHLTTKM